MDLNESCLQRTTAEVSILENISRMCLVEMSCCQANTMLSH